MRRLRARRGGRATSAFCDPLPDAAGQVDRAARSRWFRDHYESAASEVEQFLRAAGIELAGKEIADVGCGEGITDLGIVRRGRPRRLVGFDIDPVDADRLLAEARAEGLAASLPPELEFALCEPTVLPAPDDAFDIVISWSAFEHIANPVAVLAEIRRVLRPDGVFFLQLWPFYFSEQGSHLWHWVPEGFANLRYTDEEIERRLRADEASDPGWIEQRLVDNRALNRITLDGLHRALLASGLHVTRAELITGRVDLTKDLNRFPLSDLLIGGVKLLAARS